MLVDRGGADGAEDDADGDGDEHDTRVIESYPRGCEGSRKRRQRPPDPAPISIRLSIPFSEQKGRVGIAEILVRQSPLLFLA